MLTGANAASQVCQIRMSIRCAKELPYSVLTDIFKKKVAISRENQNYLYGFFEECYPSLIKRYMIEQNITRDEILYIFNSLPESGEKWKFRKAVADGCF